MGGFWGGGDFGNWEGRYPDSFYDKDRDRNIIVPNLTGEHYAKLNFIKFIIDNKKKYSYDYKLSDGQIELSNVSSTDYNMLQQQSIRNDYLTGWKFFRNFTNYAKYHYDNINDTRNVQFDFPTNLKSYFDYTKYINT